MQEEIIDKLTKGQRLDKYLKKYLSEAPGSFLYRMMRKKNIVLNGKKAKGAEILQEGDSVKFFLADETLKKFRGQSAAAADGATGNISVCYEDDDLIVINKPAGLLSQKAADQDISAAEEITAYLIRTGHLKNSDLSTFRPGTANRLDRNTTGLLTAGKTLSGSQFLAEGFRKRTFKKIYTCLVRGTLEKPFSLTGYIEKDARSNKVHLHKSKTPGCAYIETHFMPVESRSGVTLMRVHLVTGKTHQIRLHLSAIGSPIIGDYKYGDRNLNNTYKNTYGLKSQLLHAEELSFPEIRGDFAYLSGKTLKAEKPEIFRRILKDRGFDF